MSEDRTPESAQELDDALASVMNVESDAEDARADDPEPAEGGAERDPEEVLRMDPSIEYHEQVAEEQPAPRDQI